MAAKPSDPSPSAVAPSTSNEAPVKPKRGPGRPRKEYPVLENPPPIHGRGYSQNGFRHSAYATLFTREEVEFAEQHAWNDLSDEIEIARIRIRRLLVGEARQLNKQGELTDTELEEITQEVYKSATGKQLGDLLERRKFKRTDFNHAINTMMGRLESMIKTMADIQRGVTEGEAQSQSEPIGTIRVEVVAVKNVAPPAPVDEE